MPIKRKLTLTIMGISLAAVVLTVTAITAYLIYDMKKSKIQQLEVTATLTGDRNSAGLMFLDAERVNHNLEIFRVNPSVMAACIYDGNGALFAGFRADKLDCPMSAADVPRALPDMLTAVTPIHLNGEEIGSVFMASDTSEIDAYVSKILLISATVTALMFALTLMLTMHFQRTISGPILELAATAQSITRKRDYTLKANATYADETGVLARAFNEMLDEVHKRDVELLEANETLEQKVAHRTHALEEAMRKAEAASEAKSEFLRNMSHEFRTPLHAIVSFSAYGIKEHEAVPAGKLKQYFELIQQGAGRLSKLVNEVLDLAKLEHGEQRFVFERGDMRELAAEAAKLVRPLMEEKNLTLKFEHSGPPPVAICDHGKIQQIITNLLGNAIKFTPSGKSITLHTSAETVDGNTQVMLSVIDEGVGIPVGEKEAIFESFRQSSRTNTGAGGTGLGLAICRGIIAAHGGTIWAENNTDKEGASVTFRLPAAQAKAQPNHNPKEVLHEHAA